MSIRVQSSVRFPAVTRPVPRRLPRLMAHNNFRDEFERYRGGKRCRPAQDFGTGVAGGVGVGAAGGALMLGVPLLPVFGIGIVTGILGAAAGGVVGGAVGGVVGGITAAAHVHVHTPERRKLRKHVFSKFGVVPMRHQSARIVRHLESAGVLTEGSRMVRHPGRVDNALRGVRVFGRPLTSEQKQAVQTIIRLQAAST